MKPPEGLPLKLLHFAGDDRLSIADSIDTKIVDCLDGTMAAWLVFAANTHEATQAEVAKLREDLELSLSLMSLAKALEKAHRNERAETIIELRGIADELEIVLEDAQMTASLVDALLVKLSDLAPGYAKGGEGEG